MEPRTKCLRKGERKIKLDLYYVTVLLSWVGESFAANWEPNETFM